MNVFLTKLVIRKTRKILKMIEETLQSNGCFTEEELNEIQHRVYQLTDIINFLVDNKYMNELINLKNQLDEYTKLKYLSKER